ncbi:DUF4913 domain-containing protein [Corynebacterium sp. A21]|uniref:DUF4913 domain-containing protein n=1 Tax=Corynebacterium sp. A21 TaxID=3457318 RepID=UPI003FCEEF96
MDKIIEQLANDAVREALKDAVAEEVASRMSELLGDEAFTEKIERITNEKFEQAVTPAEEIEPKYKSVIEFVDGFVRQMWATTLSDQDTANWSRQWYTHPEAVARLSALWRIYEVQRGRDPENFLEGFLRVHADYHMRYLMADASVFSRCSSTDTPSVPLPVIERAA